MQRNVRVNNDGAAKWTACLRSGEEFGKILSFDVVTIHQSDSYE